MLFLPTPTPDYNIPKDLSFSKFIKNPHPVEKQKTRILIAKINLNSIQCPVIYKKEFFRMKDRSECSGYIGKKQKGPAPNADP